MKIKEVMNKVVAIEKDMSLKVAAKIMSEKNIGSLVVVNGDKILGIVTERDIVTNAANLGKGVKSVMVKNVVTISPDDELDNAAVLMRKNKIHRIPVVEDEKLVGIITATDLIANSEDLDEEFILE